MLDWFRKQEGCPVSGTRIFNAPVIKSLWRIMSEERCQWGKQACYFGCYGWILQVRMNLYFLHTFSSPRHLQLLDWWKDLGSWWMCQQIACSLQKLLRFIPFDLFGWNRYVKNINTVLNLFQDSITQHKETFDPTQLR